MKSILSEKNIDSIFDNANRYIRNRISGINSFLVINDEQIINEQYFNSHNESDRSHITSITKSVISLLIGIAIDKGFIKSIHQPMKDFFKISRDNILGEITIKELLTMSSRIVYPNGGYLKANNWIDYILGLKVEGSKRNFFEYEDGNAHLLSAIINNATGMSTNEFATEYLFGRICIGSNKKMTPLDWSTDPQGINIGGWGLRLTAREMASIGIVALNKGLYNKERIVSSDWIEESTTEKIFCRESFNLEKGYGYYWWTGEEQGYPIYFARGVWEQYIIIVPDLNMTFVFKGEERAKVKSNVGYFWRNQIFRKLIE